MTDVDAEELLSIKDTKGVSYKEIARNTGRTKSSVWKALHDKHRSGLMNREQVLHDIAGYLLS